MAMKLDEVLSLGGLIKDALVERERAKQALGSYCDKLQLVANHSQFSVIDTAQKTFYSAELTTQKAFVEAIPPV